MGETDKARKEPVGYLQKEFNDSLARFQELVMGIKTDKYPEAARAIVMDMAKSYLDIMGKIAVQLGDSSKEELQTAKTIFKDLQTKAPHPDKQKFLELIEQIDGLNKGMHSKAGDPHAKGNELARHATQLLSKANKNGSWQLDKAEEGRANGVLRRFKETHPKPNENESPNPLYSRTIK